MKALKNWAVKISHTFHMQVAGLCWVAAVRLHTIFFDTEVHGAFLTMGLLRSDKALKFSDTLAKNRLITNFDSQLVFLHSPIFSFHPL
jgi:hypothetical protein